MPNIEPYAGEVSDKQSESDGPGYYGKQAVVPPAFPDVDEPVLNDLGNGLMALADHLDGDLIPHHAHQWMQLSDWEAGRLAAATATAVLGSYGEACAAAYACACRRRSSL